MLLALLEAILQTYTSVRANISSVRADSSNLTEGYTPHHSVRRAALWDGHQTLSPVNSDLPATTLRLPADSVKRKLKRLAVFGITELVANNRWRPLPLE